MATIKQIFQSYGPAYLTRFGENMPENHKKVIQDITACRTESNGTVVYECTECGRFHTVPRSCGNRHCPNCQHDKTRLWLDRQLDRQLPGHHFMITFTVPEELRFFIRSHQKICYAAMFKASSEAMKILAKDEKYIGGDQPGFFGVLHTWGSGMQYHPHIHYVVAGGAYSKTSGKWHRSRIDYYVPIEALAMIFRAKFRDELKKTELFAHIPQHIWNIHWNVNIEAVGHSENSIRYLSFYVFKVAITDSRIVSVTGGKVTFRYKDKKRKARRWRTMTLDAMEFIRRYLQHVLPTGFMKIRYYGFMNPNSSVSTEEISGLIELSYGFEMEKPKADQNPTAPPRCPYCGGRLKYLYSVLPHEFTPRRDTG